MNDKKKAFPHEMNDKKKAFPMGSTTTSFYAQKQKWMDHEDYHANSDRERVKLNFMTDSLLNGLPKNYLIDTKSGLFYSIGLYYTDLARVPNSLNSSSRELRGIGYFPSSKNANVDVSNAQKGRIFSAMDDLLGITYGEPVFTLELDVQFINPIPENRTVELLGEAEIVGKSKSGSLKIKESGVISDKETGVIYAKGESMFVQTATQAKMYSRMLALHAQKPGDGQDNREISDEEMETAMERREKRKANLSVLRVKKNVFLTSLPYAHVAEEVWAKNDRFVRALNADRKESRLRGYKARSSKFERISPTNGRCFLRVFANERELVAPVLFLITCEGHSGIAHGGAVGSALVECIERAYGSKKRDSNASKHGPWTIRSLMLQYRGQVPLETTLKISFVSDPREDSVRDDVVFRTYRGSLDSDDGRSVEDVVLYDEVVVVVSTPVRKKSSI